MRAAFEKVETNSAASFHVQQRVVHAFDAPWHYHPEYELTFIAESCGRRLVGDRIEPFRQGDLVLLGPHLPHLWVNDPGTTRAQSVVVQFLPDFAGREFLNLPEMGGVARLLKRAARGLHFRGKAALPVTKAMQSLLSVTGLARFTLLLEILGMLASSAGGRPLSGKAFNPVLDTRASERINRAYRFVLAHFRENIGLEDVASIAGMSPAAFSRYFKQLTRQNVKDFLTQTRLDHSARLLLETEQSVSEICYASGFNNLSNFNRRFLESRTMTPTEFRRQGMAGFSQARDPHFE